ncbi:MAG: hypothetical protein QXI58_01620 [Candidatus Micrarchaeia archaeon]
MKNIYITKFEIRLISLLYYWNELGFNEIYNKIGGSKDHLNERLKRLIDERIIIKKDNLYSLSDKGKNIFEMLTLGFKIDLLKYYFIEKLQPFISSLKYISIPLIYKIKKFFKEYIFGEINRIEKFLKDYCIAFLYVESLSEKIGNNKEEIINNIEYTWKNIEKSEEKIFNVKFDWNDTIKKLLKELENIMIKRKIIECFKERIDKNKEKLFEDLKNFSRKPYEYLSSISIRFYERSIIGMINGTILTIIFFTMYYVITFLFDFPLLGIIMIMIAAIVGFHIGFIGSIISHIIDKAIVRRLILKRIINTAIISSLLCLLLLFSFFLFIFSFHKNF